MPSTRSDECLPDRARICIICVWCVYVTYHHTSPCFPFFHAHVQCASMVTAVFYFQRPYSQEGPSCPEKCCVQVYLEKDKAEQKKGTAPVQPSSGGWGEVARLLSRKHDRIDPLQALSLLPDQARPFCPALKSAMEPCRSCYMHVGALGVAIGHFRSMPASWCISLAS